MGEDGLWRPHQDLTIDQFLHIISFVQYFLAHNKAIAHFRKLKKKGKIKKGIPGQLPGLTAPAGSAAAEGESMLSMRKCFPLDGGQSENHFKKCPVDIAGFLGEGAEKCECICWISQITTVGHRTVLTLLLDVRRVVCSWSGVRAPGGEHSLPVTAVTHCVV